jgi:hypothetical protein
MLCKLQPHLGSASRFFHAAFHSLLEPAASASEKNEYARPDSLLLRTVLCPLPSHLVKRDPPKILLICRTSTISKSAISSFDVHCELFMKIV